MGKCSICGKIGHNKNNSKFHPIKMEISEQKHEYATVEEHKNERVFVTKTNPVLVPYLINTIKFGKLFGVFQRDSVMSAIRAFDTQMRDKSAIKKCVEQRKKNRATNFDGFVYYKNFGIHYTKILYAEIIQKRLSMLEGFYGNKFLVRLILSMIMVCM